MSETIRQISIVILFGLAFFCLQVGVFLMSGLFGDEPAEKNALALVKFAQGMLEDIEDFNVASRMESSGETSKIHVSEHTMALTKNDLNYTEAIKMEIKGKGEMKTYFLK